MRILQVGKYFPPHRGGIETVTYEMAKALPNPEGEFYVDTLCFADSCRSSTLEGTGGRLILKATLFTLFSMAISFEYIMYLITRGRKYDLVHLHYPNPLGLLCLLALPRRVKIVIHWHSDIVKQKNLEILLRPLVKLSMSKASLVIAPTQAHFSGPLFSQKIRSKCKIMPFILNLHESEPVDTDLVSVVKKTYSGRRIIFSSGRHVRYKGFEYLIAAAKKLPQDVVVLIGGSGPNTSEYRALIKDLSLQDKVFLLGGLNDKVQLAHFDACDVFCLASVDRSEMLGLVQLEAMARGKPVVSTRIRGSGVPLINKNEVTGLLVEPADPSAIAAAIMRILEDNDLYKRLASNCSEYLKAEVSRFVIVERYRNLYRALI